MIDDDARSFFPCKQWNENKYTRKSLRLPDLSTWKVYTRQEIGCRTVTPPERFFESLALKVLENGSDEDESRMMKFDLF
jgi:hypothetical protein